ncbi:MAG: cation:proton antiporter [Bacteroidales bacterium]|nr:cation:proton antiporter [Bacteroidales bacterium]
MIDKHIALINEPVLIFTTILLIILIVPLILKQSKVPAIVGLILSGFLLGPQAFNVIGHSDIIELFSEVGLLYLMFLAGLEFEMVQFRRTRLQNIVFGLLSFAIPFAMAYIVASKLFGWSDASSVLVGIMLASNTLIAFPIVERYGITKSLAVNIAIGGTIIADTIVLLILAVVSSSQNSSEVSIIRSFVIPFVIFLLLIFFGLPRLSKWFFRIIPADSKIQFLFILNMMFASSLGAEFAGAEPIIGAFFAGLILNNVIPQASPLMSRINFVGNTLFIPVFLISVGMLLDLSVVISSIPVFFYALLIVVMALSGKWLAAWLTKIIFLLTKIEMYTLYGLTTARAAATLAIAFVGLDFGLLSTDIFNAVMVLIIVTSLYSSFITDKYGKKMALSGERDFTGSHIHQNCRILIPVSNPETANKLVELAVFIKTPGTPEPIYPLSVIKDDREAQKNVHTKKTLMNSIIKNASESGVDVEGLTRLDVNVPVAIVRVSKELSINKIIIGWSGQSSEIRRVFGNMLEYVVLESPSEVIVCSFPYPLSTVKKVLVIVPDHAEMESGFESWMESLLNFGKQINCTFTFRTGEQSIRAIKKQFQIAGMASYISWENADKTYFSNINSAAYQLIAVINARPQSVSYAHDFWKLTFRMNETISKGNFVMLYPENIS